MHIQDLEKGKCFRYKNEHSIRIKGEGDFESLIIDDLKEPRSKDIKVGLFKYNILVLNTSEIIEVHPRLEMDKAWFAWVDTPFTGGERGD